MPYGTAGLALGGIGAFADMLGGNEMTPLEKEQERMMKQKRGFSSDLWQKIMNLLNNPGEFMAGQQRAIAPQMNQMASQVSSRAGLDSGNAQGALAKYQMGLLNQGWMGQQSELRRLLAGLAG